ncbi:MAG: hypothetical protein ACFFCP_15125, partial [Promethearchaeota archaeon]
MLGGIFKPILKLAAMLGAVLFATILLAGMAVLPLHYMNPATPQLLRTVGAGIPILCFGAGFLALVFTREWRVLKYAAPVGFLAPCVVFAISSVFALPQILSTMTPLEIATVCIVAVSGVVIVYDGFFGGLSGSPWLYRSIRQKTSYGLSDVGSSVAVSESTTNIVRVGAFEVVETPEEYIKDSEKPDIRVWEPFRNVLRAMMATGAPLGYRLER